MTDQITQDLLGHATAFLATYDSARILMAVLIGVAVQLAVFVLVRPAAIVLHLVVRVLGLALGVLAALSVLNHGAVPPVGPVEIDHWLSLGRGMFDDVLNEGCRVPSVTIGHP